MPLSWLSDYWWQAKMPGSLLYQDTGNASQTNPTCPGAEIWNSFYPPGPSMSLTMGPLQWSTRVPRVFFHAWGSHLSWSQDRVCDQAVFLWNAKFSLCPLLSRSLEIQGTLDRRLPSMRKNSALCFEKIITIWKNSWKKLKSIWGKLHGQMHLRCSNS